MSDEHLIPSSKYDCNANRPKPSPCKGVLPIVWWSCAKDKLTKAYIRDCVPSGNWARVYQALREDRPDLGPLPVCPPLDCDKAIEKARLVLLGDEATIQDPRTLYALACVTIGLWTDQYKDGGFITIRENGDT